MVLKRLTLESFGRFREPFAVEFAPGLTVVRGPNEAGKSTLREALRVALFEKPTAKGKEMDALRTWGTEGGFVLGLDYEAQGHAFGLVKDFRAGRALLRQNGETMVHEPTRTQEILGQHLAPLNDERVFCALTCVEQRALDRLVEGSGKDRTAMEATIEAAVTGGEDRQRAAEVLASLDRAVAALSVGLEAAHKKAGPLKQAMDRVAGVEGRLESVRVQAEMVAEARQQESEAEAVLAALQQEHREKQQLLEACTKAENLRRETESALKEEQGYNDRLERLAKLHEAAVALGEQQGALAGAAALSNDALMEMGATLAQAGEIEKRLAEGETDRTSRAQQLMALEDEIAKAEAERHAQGRAGALTQEVLLEMAALEQRGEEATRQTAGLEAAARSVRAPMLVPGAAMAVVLAILGLVIRSAAAATWALVAWVGAAAFALMAVACWAVRARRLQGVRADLRRALQESEQSQSALRQRLAEFGCESAQAAMSLRGEFDALERRLENLHAKKSGLLAGDTAQSPEEQREQVSQMREGVRRRLADAGFASLEDATSARAAFEKLHRDIASNQAEQAGRLGAETGESLEQKRKGAARRRRDAEEILREDPVLARAAQMGAEEVTRLRSRAGELQERIEEERRVLAQAQARREQLGNAPDEVAALEAELAVARRHYEALERQRDVRQCLREMLEAVVKEFDARWKPRVAERVGELLSGMTRGRYRRIETSEGVDFRLYPPGSTDEGVRPTQLSQSTKEQLYLAARIALLEQMSPENPLPLILDDPFASFDADRRAAAARMCKRLAERHQVILLTCSEEYDALADRVEILPPPAGGERS